MTMFNTNDLYELSRHFFGDKTWMSFLKTNFDGDHFD